MVASEGCGEHGQELIGELKSLLGHRKVLSHSMLLIAGKMCRSHFAYKVKIHSRPTW